MPATSIPTIAVDTSVQEVLTQLLGLPFLFARPSYGEELTLHFGQARPMRHPKLRHLTEGSHIVRTRLSGWTWSRRDSTISAMTPGERIATADFRERCSRFADAYGARVSSADAQVITAEGTVSALVLLLVLSDEWRVRVYPEPSRQAADDDEIVDWEVFTPKGSLLVGPGAKIDWEQAEERALEPRPAPADFEAMASEFEARVRATKTTAETDVILVYHCEDEHGQPLPDVRTNIVPKTKIQGFKDRGQEFAAMIHLDTILGNINSLVRHAPRGVILLRDAPQMPLRITGFDLEIDKP